MFKKFLIVFAALPLLALASCEERNPEEEDTGWKLPGYTLESINYTPVTMSTCGIDLKVTLPETPAEGVEFGVMLHDDPRFPHDKGLIVKTFDEVESSTCLCFIIQDLLQRKYYYKGYYAQGDNIRFTETKSFFPGAVDLGLSVQWCCMNIGAEKPEEYGNFYAWGETEPKTEYTSDNYKYDREATSLTAEADVAAVTLKGHWRMPTCKEINELIDPAKCKVEWTQSGVTPGLRISSIANPDQSIFLPAAGGNNGNYAGETGCYWASDKSFDIGCLYFYEPDENNPSGIWELSNSSRVLGHTVRAVWDSSTPEPAPEDTDVLCVDAPLFIETPTIPSVSADGGKISITDMDGNTVDEFDLDDLSTVTSAGDFLVPRATMDENTPRNTFHNPLACGGSRVRTVHYTAFRFLLNGIEVHPHCGALDFGKEYTLTVSAGALDDIASALTMNFKTKAKPSSTTEFTVSSDGEGDFCTIQGAINYACKTAGKDAAVTIDIAPGTYSEMLFLRDKNNLTLRGTGKRDETVIQYLNREGLATGTGASANLVSLGTAIGAKSGRCIFLVENCDNLCLENLTIRNEVGQNDGQAETLYFNSGSNAHKLIIENCELWSWQDTFLTKGVVWVHKSLIAGHCDYIWGYPKACLFEDCEIRSRAGGYIVQARIPNANDKGFVFLRCTLTSEIGAAAGSMYLARSGGDTSKYDNVTYIECTMCPVISVLGWYDSPAPNPSTPSAYSGWKEYGSKDHNGKAIDTGNRSRYGIILTSSEAMAYSARVAVLGF
ncbi:MAG: hypothetical protein IKX37_00625 [Bacteroidales bacterium]|nr:hypothetical protein [Bacteroidales bacterium]